MIVVTTGERWVLAEEVCAGAEVVLDVDHNVDEDNEIV